MKAVVYAGPGEVRVEEVPRPRPREADDAIVRVQLAAICGSDLHVLDGKTPGMREGGVIGHEFVGEVTETGDSPAAPRVGERVAGSFLIVCGRCGPLRRRAIQPLHRAARPRVGHLDR